MGELAPSAAIAGVITGSILTVFLNVNELWALGDHGHWRYIYLSVCILVTKEGRGRLSNQSVVQVYLLALAVIEMSIDSLL